MTRRVAFGKPKVLGSGGSIVAKLILKGSAGRVFRHPNGPQVIGFDLKHAGFYCRRIHNSSQRYRRLLAARNKAISGLI